MFAGDTKKARQSVQKYILKQDDRGQTKKGVKKELAAVIHSFSPEENYRASYGMRGCGTDSQQLCYLLQQDTVRSRALSGLDTYRPPILIKSNGWAGV